MAGAGGRNSGGVNLPPMKARYCTSTPAPIPNIVPPPINRFGFRGSADTPLGNYASHRRNTHLNLNLLRQRHLVSPGWTPQASRLQRSINTHPVHHQPGPQSLRWYIIMSMDITIKVSLHTLVPCYNYLYLGSCCSGYYCSTWCYRPELQFHHQIQVPSCLHTKTPNTSRYKDGLHAFTTLHPFSSTDYHQTQPPEYDI